VPTPEILGAIGEPLNGSGIPYFVTGSVAAIVYGEPRLTVDVDLVLQLVVRDASRVVRAFPDAEYYCPPLEVLEAEAARPQRGHFNIIHYATGFRADVYLAGADPLHTWAMQRRHRVEFGDQHLWIAPPEYVIVRKLEFYREGHSEKHLADIRGILAACSETLQQDWLDRTVRDLGLAEVWGLVE
jgi:hypothetical protein